MSKTFENFIFKEFGLPDDREDRQFLERVAKAYRAYEEYSSKLKASNIFREYINKTLDTPGVFINGTEYFSSSDDSDQEFIKIFIERERSND